MIVVNEKSPVWDAQLLNPEQWKAGKSHKCCLWYHPTRPAQRRAASLSCIKHFSPLLIAVLLSVSSSTAQTNTVQTNAVGSVAPQRVNLLIEHGKLFDGSRAEPRIA